MVPTFILRHASLVCAFTALASAQDGGQLFTLHCSACHAPDGKGAGAGAFPPLAGSPFIAGDADRAIKIVLHGLQGPVEVLGKTYNLEMPPQGAAIVDDQIAAILTYVRSSWGNKESAVSTDLVKKIRAETSSRTEHWSAAEILKLHPIRQTLPLTELLSYTYKGSWKSSPEFTKLTPTATEEEPSGKIALPKTPKKGKKAKAAAAQSTGNLGIVWEGTLTLPADAEYDFRLEADDGGRLILDGKILAEVKGAGPAKARGVESTATFRAGPHKLRAEYYNLADKHELHIAWRKKGDTAWNFLTDEEQAKAWPPIILSPTAGRTVIYRNFIENTTQRPIGVGFPGGVNMAYSSDHFSPELVWTGAFIDAGHHWTDRGMGNEPPAGNDVVNLTQSLALPQGTLFRGYRLDPAGNPTFAAQIGGLSVLDGYTAPSANKLLRVVKVTGNSSGSPTLTLSEKLPVKSTATDNYEIDGQLVITVKSATLSGEKLVLPLISGISTEILYLWK